MRLKQRYLANKNIAKLPFPQGGEYGISHLAEALRDPFYPRFWPERLEEIKKLRKPTGIFLDDMSDWMGDYWPEEWTEMELQVMRDNQQHRFYTLTKQPQNLPQWEFPTNCWVGVTATNSDLFAYAVNELMKIQATIKYISIEPLLNWKRLNISTWLKQINWLIIGACTGTKVEMTELVRKYPALTLMPFGNKWTAQPPIEWIQEIVEAADKAGIPVFQKDNLKPLLGENLRQELPE
jgi:hypothetical protein